MCFSGGATHAAPAAEPPPTCETNEEEEHTEEEEVDGKDIKAPLELVIEVTRLITVSGTTFQTPVGGKKALMFYSDLKKTFYTFGQ